MRNFITKFVLCIAIIFMGICLVSCDANFSSDGDNNNSQSQGGSQSGGSSESGGESGSQGGSESGDSEDGNDEKGRFFNINLVMPDGTNEEYEYITDFEFDPAFVSSWIYENECNDKLYRFIGWYLDNEYNIKFDVDNLDSDCTLYAKMVEQAKITIKNFYPNNLTSESIIRVDKNTIFDVNKNIDLTTAELLSVYSDENKTNIITTFDVIDNRTIYADWSTKYECFKWEVVNNEAIIADLKGKGELVLPSVYRDKTGQDYPVTTLGNESFCEGYQMVQKITIPNSVKYIGNRAFMFCTYLTSIEIPDSVISVGEEAFAACGRLANIKFSPNIKYIGAKAFEACDALTDITLPEGITSIDNNTFSGCANLTSIVIPNNVLTMGESVFLGCRKLENITLSNNLTSIGNFAFFSCPSLQNLEMPDSVKTIGSDLFIGCENLRSVKFSNSITDIPVGVLLNCQNLREVVIGENVRTIGDRVFEGCTNLRKITPSKYMFEQDYGSSDLLNKYFVDNAPSELVIPRYVTKIHATAFQNNIGFYRTYIEDLASWCNVDIESIESSPIRNSSLYIDNNFTNDLVIPDSVTEIKKYTFANCNAINSVTFGKNVTKIDNYAFRSCYALMKVVMGESVMDINSYAFATCTRLTQLTPNKLMLEKDYGDSNMFSSYFGDCPIKEITVPEDTTTISSTAFAGYNDLTKVYINNLVNWFNIDFTSQNANPLNNSMLYINDALVTDLVVPNEITKIKKYAFAGCTSITSLTLGEGVTSIEENAFIGCSSLNAIYVADIDSWFAMKFESKECNPLIVAKNLYINDQLLTDITISSLVNDISDYVFYGCSSIVSVTIEIGVGKIGKYAFGNCENLESVTFKSINPPTASEGMFASNDKLTIYVPADSVDTFKEADGWTSYAEIIKSVKEKNSEN